MIDWFIGGATKYKKLVVNNRDLSQLVGTVAWSGDSKQVARKLVFTVASRASDRFLPKVPIREGDQVVFSYKDKSAPEKVLFGGPILDIDKAASGNSITYTALDLLFYINGSDISHVFDDTPEAITAWVCSHLGVPFGSAAPTGIRVYMPCLGKRAYEAIMAAYTAASRQNGKKYIPMMRDINKVCVIEKGTLCGAVLEGGYNLTEATYKTSLQNMVNRVVITNKEGSQVGVVEDAEARKKYGTLQRVYQQQDGKNDTAEAKALLQAIEQSGAVTAMSDVRVISGYGIIVQEPVTGLYGKFYIESDTHTFSDGKDEMQLTLAFSNMMDEKEIDKETKA